MLVPHYVNYPQDMKQPKKSHTNTQKGKIHSLIENDWKMFKKWNLKGNAQCLQFTVGTWKWTGAPGSLLWKRMKEWHQVAFMKEWISGIFYVSGTLCPIIGYIGVPIGNPGSREGFPILPLNMAASRTCGTHMTEVLHCPSAVGCQVYRN